jgi:outer membrane immunogenic protein
MDVSLFGNTKCKVIAPPAAGSERKTSKTENIMTLKTFLLATFLAGASAGSVFAQDAARWSGFYGGLSVAAYGGFEDFEPFGSKDYDLIGTSFGAFGGYTYARGAFAYGVELAVNNGDAYESNSSGSYPEYNYSNTFELKGRVGYAVGDALIYGTLGYVSGEYEYSGDFYNLDGMLYGLGVDYALNERAFAGLEYVYRDLTSTYPTEATVNTLSLRVGMMF